MRAAEAIVDALLESHRWMPYDALPDRAKAALRYYMVDDGGIEAEEYDDHVRFYVYKLHAYPAEVVRKAWYGIGWKLGSETPLHSSDEKRIAKIIQLRKKTGVVWPYIAASNAGTFKEWASDEMNHGDGYHRAVASIRSGQPVEFLFLKRIR